MTGDHRTWEVDEERHENVRHKVDNEQSVEKNRVNWKKVKSIDRKFIKLKMIKKIYCAYQ